MPISSINDVLQAKEDGTNIEDQVNGSMEEDDNNIIVQDDGTNKLIQDLFTQPDRMRTLMILILMYLC